MNNNNQSQGRQTFSGTVARVFEDGFLLNTGRQTLEVDSYDLFRDSTRNRISVGQELTVLGEFDEGEFDALSITPGSGAGGTPSVNPGRSSRDEDDLIGTSRNDVLRGTNRSDDIRGLGGNDRLIGRGGADDLLGGSGNDTLVGGSGNDDLTGSNGRDVLRGGGGNDDLVGGAGQDILIGNAGRDTFVLQPGGNDTIRDFRDRIDEFELSGGLRFNRLVIRQLGDDTLILSGGRRVALVLDVNASSITQADFD